MMSFDIQEGAVRVSVDGAAMFATPDMAIHELKKAVVAVCRLYSNDSANELREAVETLIPEKSRKR